MDALAKKYTAELVQNFNEGRLDADELRRSLERIPSRVHAEVSIDVIVNEIRTATGGSGGRYGGEVVEPRARGGPVNAGQLYLVGERGPELFIPDTAGRIAPPATAQQITQNSMQSITNSNSYNYAPTYAAAPKAPSQDFALMQAWSAGL
jgi:hypothetical protein